MVDWKLETNLRDEIILVSYEYVRGGVIRTERWPVTDEDARILAALKLDTQNKDA